MSDEETRSMASRTSCCSRRRTHSDDTMTPPSLWAACLTKLPSFDPSWSDEVRAAWFACFETLKTLAPTVPAHVR